MKAKKVLGLALSAMMAISAVVPWTGLTATAADEPQVANASQQMEERKRPPEGANVVLKGATVTFVTKDGNEVGTKEVGRGDLKIADPTYKYDGDVWFWTAKTSVTLKSPGNHVPDGYEYVSCDSTKTVFLYLDWDLLWHVDGAVDFTVVVKAEEPEKVTVGLNYYDEVNGVQVKEVEITVDADAEKVSADVVAANMPEKYELVSTDYQIRDGYVYIGVKPVEEEPTTIWVNVAFYCGEEYLGGERAELNVGVNHTSALEALETFKELYLEGYELAEKGDFWIDADQEYLNVEVRKIATTKEIGVNYWDVENNKQAGEGKVVVDKDANNVNMTQLKDIPEGYELTGYIGDYQINDGWIFVEVRPVDDPDDGDEDDNDRPTERPYFPSRPVEDIDDETTPEASDPGTTPGGGSAGPGGAGDGAVAVEDPTDTLGDNDVPRVNAPQTGRKIAGSIALLAGAAAVAVVTLKKRKDK